MAPLTARKASVGRVAARVALVEAAAVVAKVAVSVVDRVEVKVEVGDARLARNAACSSA